MIPKMGYELSDAVARYDILHVTHPGTVAVVIN